MSAKSKKKKKKSFTSPSFKQCFCKSADENVTDLAVSAAYFGGPEQNENMNSEANNMSE